MQALAETIPGSNALESFCRQDGPQREFTDELRSILEMIAKTGKYWHNWSQLKSLLCFRLAQVMQEYHASQMHADDSTTELVHGEQFSDVLDRLLQGLDAFAEGAPFTGQRLCEQINIYTERDLKKLETTCGLLSCFLALLLNPKDTYVNLEKLSLAFEKLLLVTSTEPASTDPYPSPPQPSPKHVEVHQNEQGADEILPEVLTVNGSHETNGSHKAIQDDEMVDVEGIVDRPVEAVSNQPATSEDFTMQNDDTQKTGSEEPANGHIGTSDGGVVADVTLVDKKPE